MRNFWNTQNLFSLICLLVLRFKNQSQSTSEVIIGLWQIPGYVTVYYELSSFIHDSFLSFSVVFTKSFLVIRELVLLLHLNFLVAGSRRRTPWLWPFFRLTFTTTFVYFFLIIRVYWMSTDKYIYLLICRCYWEAVDLFQLAVPGKECIHVFVSCSKYRL